MLWMVWRKRTERPKKRSLREYNWLSAACHQDTMLSIQTDNWDAGSSSVHSIVIKKTAIRAYAGSG